MIKQDIKIFISYRRDDSQYVTDSVHDHLIRHFGEENVFLDVQSIPFGVDFREFLADQVSENDAVVVIIGPDWARMMQERASLPNDFVRIEIESALDQGKLLVPVLVMEAQMPDFADLPPSIAPLQWLQSATIRRKPDLDHDCTRLAEGIRHYFAQPTSLEILPPPFKWIGIPTGPVTLENEHGTFKVVAFSIAKYPVTVGQYEVFMKDGGYTTERWWSKSGWAWLHEHGYSAPHSWDDPAWQWKADHPVIGVSWFEAYAFTRWLSERTDENIQLPTEQQWQRAAQGDDGRKFPWGNEWDGSRCNNAVAGPNWEKKKKSGNTTSPVTLHEGLGDSPFGVIDMAGNVWEWTNSVYGVEQELDVEDATSRRVVRGGSWYEVSQGDFRVTDRLQNPPDGRNDGLGFRIIRSVQA
ncbi:MAG: SUMF1/EgtB/PvdO family nonheme iron enzyme [Chloroflexi bacterium]|nr:SUMF1/EgtB/PvdO family nonheme iron enzyme [Chloroflexota bacterium]